MAGAAIPTTGQVATSTTPIQVVAADITRVGLDIRNYGTTPAYLGSSTLVSSTSGHVIPAGASLGINSGSLTTGALYAISTGSGTLSFMRW